MANKVLNTKIIIRNDTRVNFTTEDPTLLKGEIALELDTKKYKIGNGVDAYTALPYYNHLDNSRSSSLDQLITMLNTGSFGSIADVKVNGTSVITDKIANITIASISYSEGALEVGEDKLTNSSITLHKIAKTGAWSDLVGKPNIVDNLNSTSATDILSAKQGNELKKLVQAIPQATSYASVTNMITALNSATNKAYNVGHNLYIIATAVPDFWISSIESTPVTYSGTTADLINSVRTNGSVQVGYYKISMLETEKVDLTNYVTTTQLNEAVNTINGSITTLTNKVTALENTVGNSSKGLVKDVADLKTTTGGHETRIKAIEDDATIIRTTDFVVLNGGDSKTAN